MTGFSWLNKDWRYDDGDGDSDDDDDDDDDDDNDNLITWSSYKSLVFRHFKCLMFYYFF